MSTVVSNFNAGQRPTWLHTTEGSSNIDPTPLLQLLERLEFKAKTGFVPSDLQQRDIMQFLAWGRCLNLYEVGGGKTVVSTLKAILSGHQQKLVIVPPILVTPWTRWLRLFYTSVLTYRGTVKWRKAQDITAYEWLVMSHAIFRQDYEKRFKALEGQDKELIVDEAHWLKNTESILYQRVSQFVLPTDGLQLLTGTPINKPEDAYAYIKLMTPQAYRSLGHFEMIHIVDRDIYKRPTAYEHLELVQENLMHKAISRTKEELHGYNLRPLTPDSTYELSPEHYRLYERLVEDRLLELPDGKVIDATTVQRLRHALQQVVVNLAHFSGVPTDRSTAYDLIDQTIEETGCSAQSRSKLIIWTNYKMTSRNVLAYCNNLKIPTVAAYSEVNAEKSVEAFMNDPATRILVAQYQSAGAGLNPQYVCSEAIFLELSTVSLYVRQAAGRIDRTGQTKVPRMKFAAALGTVQVGLLDDLLANDDKVQRIEPTKKSIREMLLGGSGL